jgi:chromosome segregation ATPase
MKTFYFFAILLIVAFVNSSKPVDFSDIAQSLVQLHDEPVQGLAKINAINEAFQDSQTQLQNVRSIVTETCEKMGKNYAALISNGNSEISEVERRITLLNQGMTMRKGEIKNHTEAQAAEQEKIKVSTADMKNLSKQLVQKENEMNEIINVLHRLKNIAADELAGTEKNTTEMGKYNVVNNHGVSFIQKSNIRNELKSLLKNSNVAGKSLISTLILMTSNDDAHYSDPAIIAKIMNVLNNIINSNMERKRTLNQKFDEERKSMEELISNAVGMIQNLQESVIKAQTEITVGNRQVNMFNNDIVAMKRTLLGRQRREASLRKYCSRQNQMDEVYNQRYSEVFKKILELKSQMGEQ